MTIARHSSSTDIKLQPFDVESVPSVAIVDDTPGTRSTVHMYVAPSLVGGEDTAAIFRKLDVTSQLMFACGLKALCETEAKYGHRMTWNDILGTLNSSPALISDEMISNIQVYRHSATSNFSLKDTTSDRAAEEVMKWWKTTACPDPDIRAHIGFDIQSIALFVARTRVVWKNYTALLGEVDDKEVNKSYIGIKLFPELDAAYIQVYHIKLSAWSECTRRLSRVNVSSGISSEITSQIYRPSRGILTKVAPEVRNAALSELESLIRMAQKA